METVEQLTEKILRLSANERGRLALDVLDSLAADDLQSGDSDSVWFDELDARSEAYARGEIQSADWRIAIEEVRRELDGVERP